MSQAATRVSCECTLGSRSSRSCHSMACEVSQVGEWSSSDPGDLRRRSVLGGSCPRRSGGSRASSAADRRRHDVVRSCAVEASALTSRRRLQVSCRWYSLRLCGRWCRTRCPQYGCRAAHGRRDRVRSCSGGYVCRRSLPARRCESTSTLGLVQRPALALRRPPVITLNF